MAESLSGVAGGLQGMGSGLLDKGQSILDSIISPETRSEISAKISKFFTEKPMLAVSALLLGCPSRQGKLTR